MAWAWGYSPGVTRSHRARWRHAVVWLVVGLALAGYFVTTDSWWMAILVLCLTLLAAWLSSPLHQDHSVSHWDAQQRHVRDGSVVVYWRPGHLGCLRLRSGLMSVRDQILWVNVWADDEAAAFVRDVNGGSEVVPTAILHNGDAVSSVTPERVRADLAAAAG